MSVSSERLQKLRQKEKQLRAQIQLEQNRLSANARKERNGKLIAWGIVIETILNDPEESMTPAQWATQCKRFLKDRTLNRALVDELEDFKTEEVKQE